MAVTTVTASDPDAGTTFTYSISGGADKDLFTIDSGTGALSFITAPDFETKADSGANGVYDVTVQVSDGNLTDTQAVAVTVTNVNEAPVATADSYDTEANTALNVAAAGVLANDTDGDGDPLTAVLVSGPANGSLTLNADGSFTYTPDGGFVGTDRFTYNANDGTANSEERIATLNVQPDTGLDGDLIDFQFYYPNKASPFNASNLNSSGSFTVGSGVELPNPGEFDVDFSDSSIVLQWHRFASITYDAAAFNGYKFTDAEGRLPAIINVEIVSSNAANFDPSDVAWDADNIWINIGGTTVDQTDRIELSVAFADVVGTPGDDVINDTPASETIAALAGFDQISIGGGGSDVVLAGDDDDTVIRALTVADLREVLDVEVDFFGRLAMALLAI